MASLGWWSIDTTLLQEYIQRAYDGEDPEILYIELVANAEGM